MPKDEAVKECRPTKPCVCPVDAAQDPTERLTLAPEKLDLSKLTLGALGIATRVTGPKDFPTVILRQPFDTANLLGINARTVRVFFVETDPWSFRPVWDSGINIALGFVWSRISRPGVYAPLGLPRDCLLSETLRVLARSRRYCETPEASQKLTKKAFEPFLEAKDEEIEAFEAIRELLTRLEIETSPGAAVFLPGEIRLGRDGVTLPFPLPGGISFPQLVKERLPKLEVSAAGLPEEQLFFPPERPDDAKPPWLILPQRSLPRPVPQPYPGEPLPNPWPPNELGLPEDRLRLDERRLERLETLAGIKSPDILGWLSSCNWWMHHRDEAHTGASRSSDIRRTTVGALKQCFKIDLRGFIVSMPCVVAGKVYVGTSTQRFGASGALYRIDLATGHEDACFLFLGTGDLRSPHAGVGSSPAVAGGKVYFSALTGKVYCLDAVSLACQWVTDLRKTDLGHNQPVDHGDVKANCWSSPLVVGNRVYVACGEGEVEDMRIGAAFGFVYCLDALTGRVIWLFCTNRFPGVVENSPNVIPDSSFSGTPPPPFKKAQKPLHRGASPWSAPVYSAALDRIYIGTGNAVADDPLPDPKYASGLLSLDATTGEFKGFFQPKASDSYRPEHDLDVDVPAGPMVFSRKSKEYVCFGSKNGSFFILDAKTMKVAKHAGRPARRQLLPYDVNGRPFPAVDPPDDEKDPMRENKSGVFGTAALGSHLKRIYIGLGGYDGAIDHNTTPFIRAMDWVTLADAWPTKGTNPPKYCAAQPPVYCTCAEAGMSSPAVVNDVVFVSTTKPALYAFDAETGLCLWVAPGITAIDGSHAFGPAIYGNFVVNGISDGHLYIYSL